MLVRRSSRRDRARPLASLHVLSALPADCPHNPVPCAPWLPIRGSSLRARVVPCSFYPHIPHAKIDLGRYSPSWGRIASKISPGRCRNRIKRTFEGRRVRPGAQRAAEFRVFRTGRLGLRRPDYHPTEALRSAVARKPCKKSLLGAKSAKIFPEYHHNWTDRIVWRSAPSPEPKRRRCARRWPASLRAHRRQVGAHVTVLLRFLPRGWLSRGRARQRWRPRRLPRRPRR